MLSVEGILNTAQKALSEMERMNMYNARINLQSVIEALNYPPLRVILIDNDRYEQVRQIRENEIRHGLEGKV